jgi:hypothetical protein
MSLKAIDLQFAIHKNDEAGYRQNQLSQKPQQDQAVLENQAAQSTEKQRQRSAKVDETDSAAIRDRRQGSGKQEQQGKRSKPQSSSSSSEGEHPFKGHHIDLSL